MRVKILFDQWICVERPRASTAPRFTCVVLISGASSHSCATRNVRRGLVAVIRRTRLFVDSFG